MSEDTEKKLNDEAAENGPAAENPENSGEEKKNKTETAGAENKTEADGSEGARREEKPAGNTAADGAPPAGNDATAKKLIYVLGYIFWILFFLPLVVYAGDSEGKRHANQQLNMFIIGAAGNILFGVLTGVFAGTPVGLVFFLLTTLFDVAMLVFAIIGIVYAATDNKKPLPVFGAFSLIK